MATTSLWHIKGNLKDLIEYVENPEKTVPKEDGLSGFLNVFSYVKNPVKTENGEYVSSINCLKDIALQQMILTKKQYSKTDGYIAYHGYQSFKPNEISAKECHEIGVKLAREMWGDKFQIVVTTHLDKEHLHNHFCFNSVSFKDGKKYNYSKSEIKRLRDISDRLCLEHGLSVIKSPHKSPSRPIYFDEKAGKNTRYNVYRDDIRDAVNGSRNIAMVEKYLIDKGYITDFTGSKFKIRLPQYKHFTNFTTLNEAWTNDYVLRNLGARARYGNAVPYTSLYPFMPEEIKVVYFHRQPTPHIYRLYLYYCYQLGILPKQANYKPTSPYLKEDLRKLDEITAQVNYMCKYKINTLKDLYGDRKTIEININSLIAHRTKLQNKIRRATPEEKIELRTEKAVLTEKITEFRKQLKLNIAIEKRSVKIQDTLDLAFDHEEKVKEQKKNIKKERGFER